METRENCSASGEYLGMGVRIPEFERSPLGQASASSPRARTGQEEMQCGEGAGRVQRGQRPDAFPTPQPL